MLIPFHHLTGTEVNIIMLLISYSCFYVIYVSIHELTTVRIQNTFTSYNYIIIPT